MAEPTVTRIASAGGVSFLLPDGWVELLAEEHLGALVAEPAPQGQAAPTCLVHDEVGHLDLATWWAAAQAAGDGPLLLDAAVDDDGFQVTYAVVAEGRSITGLVRALHLPGRTLVITLCFPTGSTADLLPVARATASSVEVEGLP